MESTHLSEEKEFWKEQSRAFDASAAYYDIYRPGYPEELIDCILIEANLPPNAEILEIGAGSGKATRQFVDRGYQLHCIEPGSNLAATGMANFQETGRVQYSICRFEEWNAPKAQYDFAFSAQAFHWVPKPKGFELCAKALKADSYLGLYWNMYLTKDSPVDRALLEYIRQNNLMLFYLQTNEEGEISIKQNITEIKESGCFNPPELYRFYWSQRYSAEDYLGFIKTGNGYLNLEQKAKEQVDEGIISIINQHGGEVIRPYLCALYLTQKK